MRLAIGEGMRGGPALQTEETKSSYYCLCLLLIWQKLAAVPLQILAVQFSPLPHLSLLPIFVLNYTNTQSHTHTNLQQKKNTHTHFIFLLILFFGKKRRKTNIIYKKNCLWDFLYAYILWFISKNTQHDKMITW